MLERLPVAIALVSSTGHLLAKTGGMANLLGDLIPSRDATGHRWRFRDCAGRIIPRGQWPSDRALRGERDYVGMTGSYRDENGERPIRVISVPTSDPASDVAAITFLQVFENRARSAEGSHADLQQRLIDMLVHALVSNADTTTPDLRRAS